MSLRPSLGRGLLLRLLSGGGLLLSAGVVIGVVVFAFVLITRPTVKEEPHVRPIVPRGPKKDEPGQGTDPKGDEPSRERPKADSEKAQERINNFKDSVTKVVVDKAELLRREAVKRDTADDANYWIWVHIREGNYTSSVYSSDRGFTSFKACVDSPDLHPDIINGDSLYDYDFTRNVATSHSASFPKVTGRKIGEDGPSLLAAVITSAPERNPYRLEMLKSLLDKGADVNLQFGDKAHTALMVAALGDDKDVIRILLAHGAKKGLKNLDKETAADCTQSESTQALLK